jgi:dienelactone hydrolase
MTRRELISLTALGAVGTRLAAADLPGFYYRDYSRCLPDHLTALARAAYVRRNRQMATLTNAEAIRKQQRWATATLWKLIGGEPERTPLNPRITGTFDRDGYRLEKIVYESRPRVFVTANLYVPSTGKAPYPGILFQMGHSLQGKAYASYQKCCQGLARLGYVVLAFDPMGQGERIYYPDATGTNTRVGSADDEHTHPGKQLLLLGRTASQFQLWDAVRSLDYLASHPSVDPERLASTGQSGGATLTMLLACVDARLRAAVVSSGNTENFACANFNPPGSTDDAEQNFIGSGALGFDRWDLLYPLAPKPLLVLVSAHDFYGTYSPRYLDNGREEYLKLAKIYQILGHREQLDWRDTPLPHGLTYSLRLATYNWFERWLKGSARPIEREPPVSPEPVNALWTGTAGNVIRDQNSLRPFDLIQEQARQVGRASPSTAWVESLQIRFPSREIKLERLTRTPSEGVRIEAVEVRSAPEVWVPAWFFVPAQRDNNRAALLLLDDKGRNINATEDGLCHRLARAGVLTCAADVRGTGDTRPEVGRGNPGYTIPHDSEEDLAWASLILGKTLLAQRIEDILTLVHALKNDEAVTGRRIVVAARGRLTVPALFAFAASPSIDSLYLAGGLVSYQNLLETEFYRQPLANFGWDLFRRTDLPLLAAGSAPRPVHLAGAVDAAGNRMDLAALRGIYVSQNIRISSDPAWDEATLIGI